MALSKTVKRTVKQSKLENPHADCVHAIAARGVLPKSHDIKLRRYYAFAACARSSAEDAFLRPAVTIFLILSRELLLPSSDTQASSV